MSQEKQPRFMVPGSFVVGCNYVATHAGTAMWDDWRPDVVEEDLRTLAGAGMELVRVLILWPTFQPIELLRTIEGRAQEVRSGGRPVQAPEGAGLSSVAIERFGEFADMAQAQRLSLIVALVTGWMSGRLYVPPAVEGLNALSDPFAIRWEARFVRAFVQRFRSHPAIVAWDLGNECNCMAPLSNSDQAWNWTAAIAGAVRTADPTRPLLSGMHSLSPDVGAVWRIQDQAELTDMLTTHPYPIFTPLCDQDPVDTIRSILHSTAETCLYADVGGVPCMAEEGGTLGPMVADEAAAARYLRAALYSLWAHDGRTLLWWCAYDLGHLDHAPYEWHAWERELGLWRSDRSAKPVAEEMSRFRRFLDALPDDLLPNRALPRRVLHGVCILTHEQDQWTAAYGAFTLAVQAGISLTFRFADQSIPHADVYLLPSLHGGGGVARSLWLDLVDRVRSGATLYLSHGDCFLSSFEEVFGLRISSRERRDAPARFRLPSGPADAVGTDSEAAAAAVKAPIRLGLIPTRAEVLFREDDGNPVFTLASLGSGRAFFFALPLEESLSRKPGAFHRADAPPLWQVYRRVAEHSRRDSVVGRDDPLVGVTEHPLSDGRRVVVLVNYSPHDSSPGVTLASGWQWERTFRGDIERIDACDACVAVVTPINDVTVREGRHQE